jgi:hypothetical protein
MRAILRRIKKAEEKLNIDREQIVMRIKTYGDKGGFDLSNPIEEWLTYTEALEKAPAQNGLVVLSEAAEIKARRAAAIENHGAARS